MGRLQQDQGPARPHLLTHRQGPLPCEAMDTGMDAQHSPAKGGQVGEGLRVEGAQVGWERWAPQGDSLRQKGTGVGERAQREAGRGKSRTAWRDSLSVAKRAGIGSADLWAWGQGVPRGCQWGQDLGQIWFWT